MEAHIKHPFPPTAFIHQFHTMVDANEYPKFSDGLNIARNLGLSQEPVQPRMFDPIRDADLLSLYNSPNLVPVEDKKAEADEFYRMPGYRSRSER